MLHRLGCHQHLAYGAYVPFLALFMASEIQGIMAVFGMLKVLNDFKEVLVLSRKLWVSEPLLSNVDNTRPLK